ncbi:hypothetical protein ABZP36_027435 [Zizania latifolia]
MDPSEGEAPVLTHEDNQAFLQLLRENMELLGMEEAKVDVRFEEVSVEADVCTTSRQALPTLFNSAVSSVHETAASLRMCTNRKGQIKIINGVSGTIRSSRMTLVLGAPGSGKTTFLKALAGKLDPSLKLKGKVMYNGEEICSSTPHYLRAYVSQHDLHHAEMTVRETINFSSQMLGTNHTFEMLGEAIRKQSANNKAEKYIELFTKANTYGARSGLATNYIIKILGLSDCADTIIGDDLRRGDLENGPETILGRFFQQLLVLFVMHQMSMGLYRLLASIGRTQVMANTLGTTVLIPICILGGFIIPKDELQLWLRWGYWASPFTYAQNAISMNEFLDNRWAKEFHYANANTIGKVILKIKGLLIDWQWYWICVNILFGFSVVFNILSIFTLQFLNPPYKHKVNINIRKVNMDYNIQISGDNKASTNQVILPFQPLSLVFNHINYFVDMPKLLLMKRGGQLIYSGSLGPLCSNMINYFEAIPGVPRIHEGQNPAAWMLDISSQATEYRIGLDYAQIYHDSSLYKQNMLLVDEQSKPEQNKEDIYFPPGYWPNFKEQWLACLWKQHCSYWKNPEHNLARIINTFCVSIIIGIVFWKIGLTINEEQDIFNILGVTYGSALFLGYMNATMLQPIVAMERVVLYRETASGMYSATAYAIAQIAIEVPYMLVQVFIYTSIVYPMTGFQVTATKLFWFSLFMVLSFLYYTVFAMVTVALTPNVEIAAALSFLIFILWNIFSGFIILKEMIPAWWRWMYWADPAAWTVYGLTFSQLGERTEVIRVPGRADVTVREYLEVYIGLRDGQLPLMTALHLAAAALMAALFCLGIKHLRFQRR